jgi:hypothetical protein
MMFMMPTPPTTSDIHATLSSKFVGSPSSAAPSPHPDSAQTCRQLFPTLEGERLHVFNAPFRRLSAFNGTLL